MKRKSKISETDKALFQNAMRNVKPLSQHSKIKSPPAKPVKQRYSERLETEFTDEDELPPVSGSDYLQFARPGIQHKLLRKLKAGQYNAEATLDLHGLTAVEAKEALGLFLQNCQEQYLKHVLIIHGKGRHGDIPVLKNRLNHWLRQSHKVLAFCTAKMKQGHSGALYVLLRALKKKE